MARIREYHAHVYYRDADERARAARVRSAVEGRFDVKLGRWRVEPVGPHPEPMYQVAFPPEQFAELVPWLCFHHEGLPVLVHPETGEHRLDHTERALWLGERLAIRADVFDQLEKAAREGAKSP